MNIDQQKEKTGNGTQVLIPVDFSPKGRIALKVGFELARRLDLQVTLLHATITATPFLEPQYPEDYSGIETEDATIEGMEIEEEMHTIDEHSMDKLKRSIEKLQQNGDFPDIEFQTAMAPGMPEEVIAEYCSLQAPEVIVMATRGREKRHEELIGSVTAEVIDNCVAPVFTVPEDYTFSGFKEIVRICAFCYFDEGDADAITKLMKMFGAPEVQIYLFPATDKIKGEKAIERLDQLQVQLQKDYPSSKFNVGYKGTVKNLREELEEFFGEEKIQLVLTPNRKRNTISRIFNPSLAHKILYAIDIPMLVIPVY